VYSADDPERWDYGAYAQQQGYGNYYVLNINYFFKVLPTYLKSYCSHFKLVKEQHPQPYNSFVDSNNLLIFVTDRETSKEDWIAWLRQKYAEGDPVTVLVKRKTTLDYDITNTDLGISILDLTNKIPYSTICLEVSSGLTVPITVNYAKWGGADE
jgi:hypothetical protein